MTELENFRIRLRNKIRTVLVEREVARDSCHKVRPNLTKISKV